MWAHLNESFDTDLNVMYGGVQNIDLRMHIQSRSFTKDIWLKTIHILTIILKEKHC